MPSNRHPLTKGAVTFNGLTLTPDEYTKVVSLFKGGLVIDGIKEIRRITGSGLKEAKDFCDDIRTKLGIMPTHSHPGNW